MSTRQRKQPAALPEGATYFKHLPLGARFKFVHSPFAGPYSMGRENWTWVKTDHGKYRSPHSPSGRKYDHRTTPNALVFREAG